MPPYFLGSTSPSLNVGDVIRKGSAASVDVEPIPIEPRLTMTQIDVTLNADAGISPSLAILLTDTESVIAFRDVRRRPEKAVAFQTVMAL